MSTVLFEVESSVAWIRMNRPEKYNSFNREMALRMQQLLDECEQDRAVRAVVITGAGKGFCAGQDLGEFPDPVNIDFEKIISEHYNPLIRRIRTLSKPVIAAVNGVAAGAGANLAIACDIVIASQSAVFIQAFSKIGLIPDSGGTFFLPRMIGSQRAAALMMLADKVTADEAAQMGMIYRSVPDAQYEESVRQTAGTLAAMPTRALAYIKQALHASASNTLEEQLQLEQELQTASGKTEDFAEGVTAFLEKRKAVFTGR